VNHHARQVAEEIARGTAPARDLAREITRREPSGHLAFALPDGRLTDGEVFASLGESRWWQYALTAWVLSVAGDP